MCDTLNKNEINRISFYSKRLLYLLKHEITKFKKVVIEVINKVFLFRITYMLYLLKKCSSEVLNKVSFLI